MIQHKLGQALTWATVIAVAWNLASCSLKSWNQTLPSTTELQPPSGYLIARTIIHLHSPLSYDACKDNSQAECMASLRAGLCMNQVDFAFLTDHPSHMAEHEMADLLLSANGDQPITQAGAAIANQMSCPDGHTVLVSAGYEDRLMPIAMTQQLDPDPNVRAGLYITQTAALVTQLKTQAHAIVIVPHTESRETADVAPLGVDGVEIYNLHANVNPKMRHDSLGLDYFSGLVDLAVYWIDPMHSQQPDLAFLSFFQISPVYAKKWDALLALGQHVTGTAGNDSHQNFFPWKGSDGEKLDAHRRIIRWLSNHLLVPNLSLASAKAAILAGHLYVVFEALGTPVGADFHALAGATALIPGDSAAFVAGQTTIHVSVPTLHAASPQDGNPPLIKIILKRIDSTGAETTMISQTGVAVDYAVTQAGIYRAEISIVPNHLAGFLSYQKEKTSQELPWIIANPFYIN